MSDEINHFVCLNPAARAKPADAHCSHPNPSDAQRQKNDAVALTMAARNKLQPFHRAFARQQMHFPDKRLIQWDCGKLQVGCDSSCCFCLCVPRFFLCVCEAQRNVCMGAVFDQPFPKTAHQYSQ